MIFTVSQLTRTILQSDKIKKNSCNFYQFYLVTLIEQVFATRQLLIKEKNRDTQEKNIENDSYIIF